VIVSSLTQRDIKKRLSSGGLFFRSGPFIVHLKTKINDIVSNFYKLYCNYELIDDADYADFHIRIDLPLNIRRWVKPQVFFYLDDEIPFKPLPLNQAYPMFEWGLNWCIANHSHQYLIIHAAVVEKNDKAIILPAQPGSGKSTLSAALVSSGWRLLSDELALVATESLTVIPLARPVNLKNESIDIIKAYNKTGLFSGRFHETNKGTVSLLKAPDESITRMHEVAVPAFIVQPAYQAGQPAILEEQSRGKMFMHVAENSFNYSVLAENGFATLCQLIDNCECYKFTYSNLQEAVGLLDTLVTN